MGELRTTLEPAHVGLFQWDYWIFLGTEKVGAFRLYKIPTDNERMFLACVMVQEKFRGQGFGSELMTHALAEARSRFGAKRMQLEVVKWNTTAITLYRKFGFVPQPHLTASRAYHVIYTLDPLVLRE